MQNCMGPVRQAEETIKSEINQIQVKIITLGNEKPSALVLLGRGSAKCF